MAPYPATLKRIQAFVPPVLWTIILLALCLAPGKYLPQILVLDQIHFDKLVHFCLFGGFTLFWAIGFSDSGVSRMMPFLIFFTTLAVALGVSVEFMQKYWIPGRDFEIGDMVADAVGAITVALLFPKIRRILENLRSR